MYVNIFLFNFPISTLGGIEFLLGPLHFSIFWRQTERFLGDVHTSCHNHCLDGILMDLQSHPSGYPGAGHSRLCRYFPRGNYLHFSGVLVVELWKPWKFAGRVLDFFEFFHTLLSWESHGLVIWPWCWSFTIVPIFS